MFRERFEGLRRAVAFAMLWAGLTYVPAALGQGNHSAKGHAADVLALPLETKDFLEPMPLKNFLQLIYENCAARGVDLPILVDIGSFKEEDDSQPNGPYDDETKLPPVPKTLTIGHALQLGLSQIKSNNGTFIVRNGTIVVMTRRRASLAARLREPVLTRFEKTPLTEVMQRLSDMTGATVLLDPRLHEKAQTPITADFRGDVPLESALRAVADMADLRIVLLIEGGVYVTTPANAEALEKQIRERRKELDNEKAKAKAKDAAP
jgi:hypothetical protein